MLHLVWKHGIILNLYIPNVYRVLYEVKNYISTIKYIGYIRRKNIVGAFICGTQLHFGRIIRTPPNPQVAP